MPENNVLKQQVTRMITCLISDAISEEEADNLFEEISRLAPDPGWSEYVFHSNEYYNEDETLDVDAVVQKIFSYQAIQL